MRYIFLAQQLLIYYQTKMPAYRPLLSLSVLFSPSPSLSVQPLRLSFTCLSQSLSAYLSLSVCLSFSVYVSVFPCPCVSSLYQCLSLLIFRTPQVGMRLARLLSIVGKIFKKKFLLEVSRLTTRRGVFTRSYEWKEKQFSLPLWSL